MEEPHFINCEPNWLLETEQPCEVFEQNIVKVKVEPDITFPGPSEKEEVLKAAKEEPNLLEVVKEEPGIQEIKEEIDFENNDIGGIFPDQSQSLLSSTINSSHAAITTCGNHSRETVANNGLSSGDAAADDETLLCDKCGVSKQTCSSSSSNSDTSKSESDFPSDVDIQNPNYEGQSSSSSLSAGVESEEEPTLEDNVDVEKRKGKKRREWKKTIAKQCRNSGKGYVSSSISRKVIKAKTMGGSCSEKCRLKCSTKIKEDHRQRIFDEFWKLGDLQRQREFISVNIESISQKYKYAREGRRRSNNNAFYFCVAGKKVRVCKTYFKNTLAITDRPIRTVLQKKSCAVGGILASDLRGKHGRHRHIDEDIKEGVRHHINSIPKIESHYYGKDSKNKYIECNKTVAELHRDYVNKCKEKNEPFAKYLMYFRIFKNDFNISFYKSRKEERISVKTA